MLRFTLALAIGLLAAIASYVPPAASTFVRADKPKVHGTNQASTRLMKELVEIYKSDSYKNGVIEVELEEDNLYEWNVKMFFTDPKSKLCRDLQRMKSEGKEDHVMIRISFGDDYPNSPPFVRFVYPILNKIKRGALCMHLLSQQGWFSACSTEALILTIMGIMTKPRLNFYVDFIDDSPETRKARYTPEEAQESFREDMKVHGWDKPTDRID